MITWFITLRHADGREEFRSCRRETEVLAYVEAMRMAQESGPLTEVIRVAPLRTGLKSLGKSAT